jgi:hypothetical protein
VEHYRIPKEYFAIDELDENGEEKIYKPTGPDGRGWGEFRVLTPQDIEMFERIKQNELEREEKRNVRTTLGGDFVIDEDERWEKEFEKMVDEQKNEEAGKLISDRLEKERKKAKKKLKKEKKQAKELKREQKREQKLLEIYKSYGVEHVRESRSNVIEKKSDEDDSN